MLFSATLRALRPCSALRDALREGYGARDFSRDLMAGLTVGIIAVPLAMALAIASGVPPQYGLYTAIIAGILIPLIGGSRYSVSGPTAAFVVILYPIAQDHGLSGLLVASLMSGAILVLMALARLGRLIEYIPQAVTLGFTSGIAVVIAILQLKDFLGLPIEALPSHFFARLSLIGETLPQAVPAEAMVGGLTLAALMLWPRLRLAVPGYLPALGLGVLVSWLLGGPEAGIDTLGSRFVYELDDGTRGAGIPPVLPEFTWPWLQPGPQGQPLDWNLALVLELLPAAFSIAMLGAIESLLCAVVLDGMSGRRHHSNAELLGQGLGNLVTPWFGGITATAAIARSAANYRAGARSPLAAVVHGLVVLASMLLLAPWLAWIPMASMAALLLVVAWKMSEAPKVVELVRRAPAGDVWVFLVCFSLTVMVDMVVAISCGVVLAALLFMRDIARMTRVTEISTQRKHVPLPLPDDWGVYKISGPLFYAAADRIFDELAALAEGESRRVLVLYMDAVPILDAGGCNALQRFLESMRRREVRVVIADLQFQPLKTLARARLRPSPPWLSFSATLAEAVQTDIAEP